MQHKEYLMKKATDFESVGKLLHAIQIYENLIASEPEYTMAYVRLSELYDRLNKVESAFKLLVHYIEEFPEDKEVRLYLGQLYLKHLKWNEAIDVLSVIFPDEQPIVLFFLGYAYYMLQDYEIARLNYENFLNVNTNPDFQSESYIYITKILIELQEYDEALKNVIKAEEITSSNWEVHFLYGKIYNLKGMFFHSVNALRKALKFNSSEPSINEWMGKSYLKLGDYINAEKSFLECIKAAEPTSETYSYLGLVCLNTRKIDQAIEYFEKALTLDPSNTIALDGRNRCTL